MNHVTRGLGSRSGMLATAGLGRRVIFILELATTVALAASRVWRSQVQTRSWTSTPVARTWEAVASTSTWVLATLQRAGTSLAASRSWLVSRARTWMASADRNDDAP